MYELKNSEASYLTNQGSLMLINTNVISHEQSFVIKIYRKSSFQLFSYCRNKI